MDLIAECASYPDWWERAVNLVEQAIDPDGTLAFWGNGKWLQEGVLDIVGVVISHCPQRRDLHTPERPLHIPVVHPSAIVRLDAAPCFPQRTPGWFMDRHTLISASVAWKAISSDAALAALVREKLVPPKPGMSDPAANPSSPLHWGQKYEPVASDLYAEWFGVKVREYGCIRHPTVPFLGASPDGVVVSPGPMYGRMIEIKNVVNRELTGIPKRDYWVQMQLQMAACDLPLCDFLECQFIEYETWGEAEADGSFNRTADGKCKGALLMMYDEKAERIRYLYPPRAVTTMEAYVKWEREARAENPHLTWTQRTWWRLNNHSLVTVERHHQWFAAVLPRFEAAWQQILEARVEFEETGESEWSVVARKRAATGIDSPRAITKHDVSSNAGQEAKWPAGGCLIRQDPEEDDDFGEESGP